MRVVVVIYIEHPYFNDYVSWSDSPGSFYIHKVDRKPLLHFQKTLQI